MSCQVWRCAYAKSHQQVDSLKYLGYIQHQSWNPGLLGFRNSWLICPTFIQGATPPLVLQVARPARKASSADMRIVCQESTIHQIAIWLLVRSIMPYIHKELWPFKSLCTFKDSHPLWLLSVLRQVVVSLQLLKRVAPHCNLPVGCCNKHNSPFQLIQHAFKKLRTSPRFHSPNVRQPWHT